MINAAPGHEGAGHTEQPTDYMTVLRCHDSLFMVKRGYRDETGEMGMSRSLLK
jgi:hypothetical protein